MRPKPKVGLDSIMHEVLGHYHLEEKDFLGPGGWRVMEFGVGTLSELSRRTGRDVTTLRPGVKRFQIRYKTDFNQSI